MQKTKATHAQIFRPEVQRVDSPPRLSQERSSGVSTAAVTSLKQTGK